MKKGYVDCLSNLVTFYGGTRYHNASIDDMKNHITEEVKSSNIPSFNARDADSFLKKISSAKSKEKVLTTLTEAYMDSIGLGL